MGKKKFLALLACVTLVAAMALAGCSRPAATVADEGAEDVAGTYLCDSVKMDGEEVSGFSDKVILEKDGKGICAYDDEEYELRWELDGTAIAWADDVGDRFKGTVDFENGTISGTYSIDFQEGEHGELEYVFEKVQ